MSRDNLTDVERAETVLVVSANESVDKLTDLGYTVKKVSITSTTGAPGCQEERVEELKEKNVVIVPDNDEQAHKGAEDLARNASGKAASVKILVLPDSGLRKDKKGLGVNDWLEGRDWAGKTSGEITDEFNKLIETTAEWTPEDSFLPPKGEDKEEKKYSSGLNPVRVEELFKSVNVTIPWRWTNMLPEGALAICSAYMKVGKSELTYGLCVAMSQGKPFFGLDTRKCSVLILVVEEHKRDVIRRLINLGVTDEDHIHVHAAPLTISQKTVADLKCFILSNNIGFLVVDTLSRFWTIVDENNNSGIIQQLSPLLDMTRETNVTTWLNHHERKKGGESGRGIRGGGALFGLVDQSFTLERRQGGAGTQRSLKTLGRYSESPKELILDFANGKYKVLGTPEETSKIAFKERVRKALGNDNLDIKQVAQKIRISDKQARNALEALYKDKEVSREGTGKKGDPYKFSHINSFLSRQPSIGEETNVTSNDSK